MTSAVLSKIKDLLLLEANCLMSVIVIVIHRPNSMKARILQIHKIVNNVVHDFDHTISTFLRMNLYLLNKTGIQTIIPSQQIRISILYEQ